MNSNQARNGENLNETKSLMTLACQCTLWHYRTKFKISFLKSRFDSLKLKRFVIQGTIYIHKLEKNYNFEKLPKRFIIFAIQVENFLTQPSTKFET